MGYITGDYYTNIYKGEAVNDNLATLIERASDIIQSSTMYRIRQLEEFPPFIQEQIMKATAAQVEFIDGNGGLAGLNEKGGQSTSLGKFSITSSAIENAANGISPRSIAYLEPTGLLYRGLG